jgi:RNA polymerase sigma-70 factor (ECF subfamily)
MELQHSVTASTNLSPFLGTTGPREQLKSTAVTSLDCSDLGQTVALLNVQQPAERTVADSESAAKELFADNESSALRSGDDYAYATDEQLMTAAKSFDGRAFEELSGRYMTSIRKAVCRIVRNREDAEDVMQDSLLKAYCCLYQLKESYRFSTWIKKIAINSALMLLRKRKSRSEVSLVQSCEADQIGQTWDIPDPSPSTERKYARQEKLEFMSRSIKRLRPLDRSVLEQFHLEEKSMREIADTLGISVGSAKLRLFRARRALRSRLERQPISLFNACY